MSELDTVSLLQAVGGLGLFLLGMVVMTDALRVLAGARIRTALMRFTRSPTTGALTGAASTALLQSSSATTVAAVGFVGAGLMSFRSALGIVFGANLGTTVTGWIVLWLGFKLDLVALLLPCVFVGTLLKLLGKGRLASSGLALAGFGLIFVGIEQMQLGMSGLQGMLGQLDLPADTWIGRFQLLLLGGVFTVVTQSSSAGVATVLTAMHADAISLAQGLALVVGMDIGTTATAVIATIGASAATRRTGYSHFIYNVITGVSAFLLVTPYVFLLGRFWPEALTGNEQIALVLFHTGFNLLGVLLVLPVAGRFARLMMRVVPETDGSFTTRLDPALLKEPAVALDAVTASVVEEFAALLGNVRALLGSASGDSGATLQAIQQALDETHAYADRITRDSEKPDGHPLVEVFHVLDHLQRLNERCDEDAGRARDARTWPELEPDLRQLVSTSRAIARSMGDQRWEDAEQRARENSEALAARAGPVRDSIMHAVAAGRIDVERATRGLESIRWLRRVSHHLAQITHHLRRLAELPDGRGTEDA